MHKAGDLLGRVARKLNSPEAPLAWLSSSWPQIVGDTIAAHTHPVRCQNGRLEIAADAKGWHKQLDLMTRDFCLRINAAWGSTLICEVKFIATKQYPAVAAATRSPNVPALTRASRLPYELDNDHLPFIRRRK